MSCCIQFCQSEFKLLLFSLNLEELAAAILFDGINAEDALFLIQEDLENERSDHWKYDPFSVDSYSEADFYNYHRFKKGHFEELNKVLRLKPIYKASNGIKWKGSEGLALLLRRLAYPNRLVDLVPYFGRHVTELSVMFNTMVNEIYQLHKHRVSSVNQSWIDFESYARAIHDKGACLDNIWGFLDGTQLRICRPSDGQESVYNGHKRQHSLKFQSVMLPCGIIGHFSGPIEGRRHDSAMYFFSGLDDQVRNIHDSNGKQLALYADSAYSFRRYLITPFKGSNLSKLEKKFNKNMAKVRGAVEWGFGKISNNFAFLEFHRNMKVYLQPVAKLMYTGAILTNAHTCLYGSQTSTYFHMPPPSLHTYFE